MLTTSSVTTAPSATSNADQRSALASEESLKMFDSHIIDIIESEVSERDCVMSIYVSDYVNQ
jgi:hypothetical protein